MANTDPQTASSAAFTHLDGEASKPPARTPAQRKAEETAQQRKDVLATLAEAEHQYLYAFRQWYYAPDHLTVWIRTDEQDVRKEIRAHHENAGRGELWQHYKGELMTLLLDRCANTIALRNPHLASTPFSLKTGDTLHGRCWDDKICHIDHNGEVQTRPTDLGELWHNRIERWYPTASDSRASGTLWHAFLRSSSGYEAAATAEEETEALRTATLMLEVLGMILTDNRYHKIVHCGRTPRSGKSTFMKLATLLVGEQNTKSLRVRQLDTDISIASRLADKMLILMPEMAARPSANAMDFIKAASGGDSTELRKLYDQNAIDGTIRGVFLAGSNRVTSYVGANEKPEAMLRRLLCVPFSFAYNGVENDNLAADMFAEYGAGIAYDAIEAYAAVVKRGGACLLYTSPSPRD